MSQAFDDGIAGYLRGEETPSDITLSLEDLIDWIQGNLTASILYGNLEVANVDS